MMTGAASSAGDPATRPRSRPANARILLASAAVLTTTGCMATLPPTHFAAQGPPMRPEAFFAGATKSFGVLESRSGAPSKVFHVDGQGEALPDGGFRLDQTVTFDGETPQRRTWLIRPDGPHRYRASLTDASGEVTGEAYGTLFHLRYPYKSVARMEQWLYLQPDGRTVLNEGTVTVAGLVVARLSERISRIDAPPQESR